MRRNAVWRGVWGGAIAALLCVSAALADDLAKGVKQIAKDFLDTGQTTALNIAINRGGRMLLDEGYGYADFEKKIKAKPDTVYRIGSVTKQFTAVAIIQLQVAGKFALDDQLTSVLTDYPAPPKPITIKNLLQHTSGIYNFTNSPVYFANMSKDMSHEEMIARFDTLPLDFDPGSKWNYSNSGYYLLGMIIEKVSGETYADYLAKHEFVPAGLKHTAYEVVGTQHAQGYHGTGDKRVLTLPLSMTQPFSAGALVSTASDLVAWQRALVEGKLTPPDALARITSDAVPTGDKDGEKYAYGVGVSIRDGRQMFSHGGGINGFSSLLAYFPDRDETIATLANVDGFNHGALLDKIVELLDAEATDGAKKKETR